MTNTPEWATEVVITDDTLKINGQDFPYYVEEDLAVEDVLDEDGSVLYRRLTLALILDFDERATITDHRKTN